LEKFLQKAQYISGHLPTKDDHDAFEAFKNSGSNLDPSVHPYCFAWYNHISRFSERIRRSWTNSEYERVKI
jgi:hypothetical protein